MKMKPLLGAAVMVYDSALPVSTDLINNSLVGGQAAPLTQPTLPVTPRSEMFLILNINYFFQLLIPCSSLCTLYCTISLNPFLSPGLL